MKLKKTSHLMLYVVLTLLLSTIYSIIRYNIFKGVFWTDLPLYVFNKAISLSSVILLSSYLIFKDKSEKNQFKLFREYATLFAFLHILITILILSPEYYPKLFADSKFNLVGNLSLLFGALGFMLMFLFGSKYLFTKYIRQKNILELLWDSFIVLIMFHVFVMGFKGWFLIDTWPGLLPPITMLSFIILLFGMAVRISRKLFA